MRTVRVKLECHLCGKFEVEIYVDLNEHGFFEFPDAYCPECLGIMNQVINHENEMENDRTD